MLNNLFLMTEALCYFWVALMLQICAYFFYYPPYILSQWKLLKLIYLVG